MGHFSICNHSSGLPSTSSVPTKKEKERGGEGKGSIKMSLEPKGQAQTQINNLSQH